MVRIVLIIGLAWCLGYVDQFVLAQETVPLEQVNQDTPLKCIETDRIENYKVESDELIKFTLKGGQKILLRLKRHCPQLYFHRYISYTPVDGKICAGTDEIKTRAGLACRIVSLTTLQSLENETGHPKENLPR